MGNEKVTMRRSRALAGCAEGLPGPIASLAGWVAGEIVEVKAHRSGRIDRIVADEGSLVAKRQLLFSLGSDELHQGARKAERQLTAALRETRPQRLADAHQILGRIDLEPALAVQHTRIDFLRATTARLEADVRSPVAGRVLDVWVSPGQLVEPTQALGSILRDDYTFVVATFPAETLRRVNLARASVLIGTLRLAAKLQMVAHANEDVALLTLDAKSRSRLRPGQPASVFIEVH
jgi:multidrug resistance efflux pump